MKLSSAGSVTVKCHFHVFLVYVLDWDDSIKAKVGKIAFDMWWKLI